ncbi:CDP-diacylglycerol--glycerol-3-phosphate 3-phosphatidyltransferase [Natronincola peptidivorans]|uniref:CDP-diacylglycerol--glycerol-3-phosphate 3-phosphatidyltransferase n=1 Tax=Natronincola peptidivorans TaxID=426128 RepID=A0A1I0H4U5_9FIRM|nr:CDP-diacylglycerol--glycerol-3-phosphate 3-phosphatidyltransferase [Natronincola peptidivorans]SET77745.1 CDP-diacylglycerol--glycerol-3-phosphate 3-phosphatidyltransferase [Natronincola peptidivorans]
MNLPNIITVIRFFLIPIFVAVFFSPMDNNFRYSAYIFIFAGFTDALDGYIARKYNLVTKWGQVMDPLADKLMQLTVLICFTIKNIVPIWVIIIVGIKEVCLIVGGAFLYTKKEKIVIPANRYGKLATIVFYIAILSVAFGFSYGRYLVYLAIIVAAYAFVHYFRIGLKAVKEYNMEKTLDKSY